MSSAAVTRPDLAAALGRGLALRFAQRLAGLDRLDALDGRSGPLASEELRDEPGTRDDVARELVARLLRAGSDARIEPLVRSLVAGGAQSVATLASAAGISRVALARRLDDLVDAGLAERDPSSDTVAPTPLAGGLIELVDSLIGATAASLGDTQRGRE